MQPGASQSFLAMRSTSCSRRARRRRLGRSLSASCRRGRLRRLAPRWALRRALRDGAGDDFSVAAFGSGDALRRSALAAGLASAPSSTTCRCRRPPPSPPSRRTSPPTPPPPGGAPPPPSRASCVVARPRIGTTPTYCVAEADVERNAVAHGTGRPSLKPWYTPALPIVAYIALSVWPAAPTRRTPPSTRRRRRHRGARRLQPRRGGERDGAALPNLPTPSRTANTSTGWSVPFTQRREFRREIPDEAVQPVQAADAADARPPAPVEEVADVEDEAVRPVATRTASGRKAMLKTAKSRRPIGRSARRAVCLEAPGRGARRAGRVGHIGVAADAASLCSDSARPASPSMEDTRTTTVDGGLKKEAKATAATRRRGRDYSCSQQHVVQTK